MTTKFRKPTGRLDRCGARSRHNLIRQIVPLMTEKISDFDSIPSARVFDLDENFRCLSSQHPRVARFTCLPPAIVRPTDECPNETGEGTCRESPVVSQARFPDSRNPTSSDVPWPNVFPKIDEVKMSGKHQDMRRRRYAGIPIMLPPRMNEAHACGSGTAVLENRILS